jgi:(p)ppGpp synthase/HD superfamily hydrolase
MTTNPKIIHNRAAIFAVKAHAGQFRRDGVTPYVTHPLRVGNLLTLHGASDTEIICGDWHDIFEDVPEMREDLMKELISYGLSAKENFEIVSILEALNKPLDGNRKPALKNLSNKSSMVATVRSW